jgi:hypothetical protein
VTAELRAYSFETAVTDRRYSCFAEVSFGIFIQTATRLAGAFQAWPVQHFSLSSIRSIVTVAGRIDDQTKPATFQSQNKS